MSTPNAETFDDQDRGRREIARVQQHLAVAEMELRARDVSSLSESQRAARQVHVERLRLYREAGAFPRNDEVAGRTPIFVDARGTRCAMAELIHASGEVALVDAVARTRNHATISELADDAALVAWLHGNGLSLAEAALIQPTYHWDRDPFRPDRPSLPLPSEKPDNPTIPVTPPSDERKRNGNG